MQITESIECQVSYGEHDKDRTLFQKAFCERLGKEPQLGGRVLDIGCGPDIPEGLTPLRSRLINLDGVDPSEEVNRHPQLKNRWHGPFETADIPSAAYDLAYAYNVVEHIADPKPFFATLRRVLKPGAAFWALTPHGRHPFCFCVRTVENLNLKKWIASRNEGVNDYPAYYRLNRVKEIARAAEGCGFSRLDVIYIPSVHWDTYFPRPLRFVPRWHDRLLGLKRKGSMLLLAYRLQ